MVSVKEKEKKPKKKTVPKFERELLEHVDKNPDRALVPGPQNPLCVKCGLDQCGSKNPYMVLKKPEKPPLLTIVVESVSKGEDEADQIGITGQSGLILKLIRDMAPQVGIDVDRIRIVPLTLCAWRSGKKANFKTKGNWCRWHAVQDILRNRPGMIMGVGTTVLGALNHKSNAQDWSGRLLTWRGWPDDWLTDPKRVDGHFLFGKRPQKEDRIPLYAIQSPRLVYATQNPRVIKKWRDQFQRGLELAVKGVEPLDYSRPWWRLSSDPDDIEKTLDAIPDGTMVQHDTETTGLEAYRKGSKIVFHMFRWVEADGQVKSLGFPWDYPESPLFPHIKRLTPTVLRTLYRLKREGHNYAFDSLFCHGTMEGADLDKLCDSMHGDTLHMLYTLRQDTGSRGLEIISYDWAPTLAGYEEEMVMLIEQFPELLDPGAGEGGHYAKCPPELWESHLKPYVMGDVEVVGEASPKIRKKMAEAKTYQIPLAHHTQRDKFRWFLPPNREWIYKNIMLPSQRTLTAMMGRGMYIDKQELSLLEDVVPKAILAAKAKLKDSNPKIIQWVEQMEATEPDWEFDLESKDQLKTILYDIMDLPIVRLTKVGRQQLGDLTRDELKKRPKSELLAFSSTDKFTLNTLAAMHEQVRPLIEYRKQHKTYTTYVRSMRNHFNELVDKKHRTQSPYLMDDSCVHPIFNQVGTRSGRLSSSRPNAQQIPRESLVKQMYASRFGAEGCIYQGDLSQIELRLIACACGDPSMVGAFWKGIDLHSLTASKVFKTEYAMFEKSHMEWLQKNGKEKEAKELDRKRKIAKIVNFLTGYGGGPLGLQTSLAQGGVYLDISECENIIETFFDAYPALRRHIELYKDFIVKHGVAVSIFGRVRVFEEVFGDDREAKAKALRSGYNHLIQSSASDMMLVCITVIERLMRDAGLRSILMSTVHDSLVIDALRSELPIIHEICDQVINNIPEVLKLFFGESYDDSWIIAPMAGDFEVGPNYLDQRKVSGTNPDWDSLLRPKVA
jgi:DNA polymerase I-like protein with 3'-5' exonuclease and polymerase domains